MPNMTAFVAFKGGLFWRYVVSHTMDILAMQMMKTVVGWEIYERTRSPFALGMVGLAVLLPSLLTFLPVGHVIDTYNRKKLILGAESLTFAAMLGLSIVSVLQAPVPLVYAFLLLFGFGSAVSLPGRSSFFPQIIETNNVQNAITWSHVARQTGTIAGPLLGGLLIVATGGAWTTYALCAVLCLFFMMLIGSIPYKHTPKRSEPVSKASLLAGARFLWSTPIILSAITVDLFAVIFGGVTALLPIFAKDILFVGPIGLGFLRMAPAAGALLMSILLAHLPAMRRAGLLMLGSVAIYGLTTLLFGLSDKALLSFALLLIGGAMDAVSVVVRHTLLQTRTPKAILGRVYAANNVFGMSSNELGEVESGLVAALLGPVLAVVTGGIGSIVVVIGAALLWPELPRLRRLTMEEDPLKAVEERQN